MKLKWTDPAIADRMAIYDYLASKNPIAAAEIDALISAAASQLSRNPSSGKVGRVSGTREWVIHHFYLLIYEVKNDLLIILAVVHSRRQWPKD
ncbi:type II toxin-antitoxin system RelE/ParE family toxin [Serratia liquefaciens]|uniref:type II toxin-antitoxin system RelE/ParE family toxin n=1 Tax=Serratia liquefaciens TaxID=614 RepID=UPI00157E1AB6|nr:type II toxin-antitoxin system RelE/ParE family toxin [Serratia liquefaciens]MBF8107939.1 type II toxin-antitoxin system RelE/ParE family toxin [Serratia liquefaciens]MBV0844913.1 type II toxin-antitoxin system RelE/ParE family toxin [Serratia liquefaciens]NWA23196.1 type II toxin-antitoxin system RelE/ParE family toxin [Serratia liquefaciens]HBL7240203.1 type II toxin-antitoxin system RelE/ParE family toxin [Serratia liquefaciens]HDS5478078.1 type II toxin-antitoxin system RelE/ParE family